MMGLDKKVLDRFFFFFSEKFEPWELDVSGGKEKREAKKGEGKGRDTSSLYRPLPTPPKISCP